MTMNFTTEDLEATNKAYGLISNKMSNDLDLIYEGDEASEIKVHQAAVDAFVEFIENVLGRSRNEFLGVLTYSVRKFFRDDTPEAILKYHEYNCAFVKVLESVKSHQ